MKQSKAEANQTEQDPTEQEEIFCLDAWLEYCQIKVAKKQKTKTGICYILEACPWNPEHPQRSAYILQRNDGTIQAHCHHKECHGKDWEDLWGQYEKDVPLPNIKGIVAVEANPSKETPVDILIRQVEDAKHEVFQDAQGNTYVQVPTGAYAVNYELSSEMYRQVLNQMYYEKSKRGLMDEYQKQVIRTLEAKAKFEGNVFEVFKRFSFYQGCLYYYLADEENRVLMISQDGIETVKEPPIRFLKTKPMKKQPMPLEGKDFIELMKKYHLFASESDEILHNVMLVARLVNVIEQPIGIFTGPKGTSKTTSMDMDKRCLDDSTRNVVEMPESDEDFALLVASQDVLALDNLDHLTPKRADTFCRIVTDAKFVKRTKFTDTELTEVSMKSTIYINAINLLSTRSDFLDRCVILKKRPITAEERRGKLEVMEEFEQDKPYIMYGMFMALSGAIKRYGSVQIKVDGRLVDFLKWGYAIAETLGYGGQKFLTAYQTNSRDMNEELIANDEVGGAVLQYLDAHEKFKDEPSVLSSKLTEMLMDKGLTPSGKIKSSIHLSRRLGEICDSLRNVGVEVGFGKERGKRFISLTKVDKKRKRT